MKKLKLYIIRILLLIIFQLIISCNFSAGSYPYAEKYIINTDENKLIEAINIFKQQYSQNNVPKETQLIDGRNDENDLWYHIYFYFPEENQIVYCWTRPAEKGKTTFAFVSVNQGLILGKWQEINKDFSADDNFYEKRKFERRILNKIKIIYEKLGH